MRMLLVVLALLSSGPAVAAQETAAVQPASRLRVSVTDPLDVHVGTRRALTDSTLVLSAGASPLVLPLSRMGGPQSNGGKRPSVLGGVGGFLVGAAVGGAVGCAVNRDDYGVFCGGQDDTKVYVGAAVGAVVGAALGAWLFRR